MLTLTYFDIEHLQPLKYSGRSTLSGLEVSGIEGLSAYVYTVKPIREDKLQIYVNIYIYIYIYMQCPVLCCV